MAEKKLSKSVEKILNGLYSSKHEEIIKALNEIPAKGNDHVILPLLELYLSTGSSEIKEKVSKIVLQLRAESSIDILLDALKNKKFEPIREFIISSFWNNNWDMGDHIATLTEYAISGSFSTALEVLTVIENQEGPFDDELLMEAIVSTREFISQNRDDERTPLIISLNQVLENFEYSQ